MALVDFILNFVALLLWLNWLAKPLLTAVRPSGATLLSTLRRADDRRKSRWLFFAGVWAVLFLRTWLNWEIGSAVGYTPGLSFGAVVIHFRSDLFLRMLAYSILSFLWLLAGLYSWMLFLSALNHRQLESDPLQAIVRQNLAWVERWPALLKLLLIPLIGLLIWVLASPVLARLGVQLPSRHWWPLLYQGALVGVANFLRLEYLLAGLLLLSMLSTYVYLGSGPFWSFVERSGAQLLQPLSQLPLQLGRADFRPIVALALVFAIAEAARRWLPVLYGYGSG